MRMTCSLFTSPTSLTCMSNSSERNEALKVTVVDEGIGIDPENQQKIFQRFFRIADSNAKVMAGMGLGLYISAGIIQQHGGTISVQSSRGNGAAFSFQIPIMRPAP